MKNVKTILIVVAVAILAYFTYQLSTQKKSSLSENALSDFAVEDTASVDRIKLSDTQGFEVEFMKNGKLWVRPDSSCVQQHMIHLFLETFKYISVKSPVPEGAVDNINKMIIAHHKKVEIFQNGKLEKTWYIGNATQDHLATYMLLEDAEKGRSPEPFIMSLPNMYGSLDAQFSTNPLDYICSEVFVYDPLDIKEVDVQIPDSTALNFRIVALDENTFELYNNETKVELFDTIQVRKYLANYRKNHFEYINRTYTEAQVDSLRNSTPYYTIKVTDKNGVENAIQAYKKEPAFDQYGLDGKLLEFDQNKLWLFKNDGELTVSQYFVFDKLFKDIHYFEKK